MFSHHFYNINLAANFFATKISTDKMMQKLENPKIYAQKSVVYNRPCMHSISNNSEQFVCSPTFNNK